jgi:hypothetical protein
MCSVSDGEGDVPSVCIMDSFLRGLFCTVTDMQDKHFFHSKDFGYDICAADVSCLAKERCIPSVAHIEIDTSQQFLERRGTLG